MSTNDYQKAYGIVASKDISELKLPSVNQVQIGSEWTLHRKLLWAVLATRRVVFVGFSMKDPYFEKMLETVSEDLWRWDKSIHFAIMSISPNNAKGSKDKAKMLKNKYGVDAIFYEDFDGSHLRLEHIVAEVAKACGVKIPSVEIPSTVIPQEQPNGNDRSEDEKLESATSESEDQSDWLERANQRMERKIEDAN